jgi:hypothetical protein
VAAAGDRFSATASQQCRAPIAAVPDGLQGGLPAGTHTFGLFEEGRGRARGNDSDSSAAGSHPLTAYRTSHFPDPPQRSLEPHFGLLRVTEGSLDRALTIRACGCRYTRHNTSFASVQTTGDPMAKGSPQTSRGTSSQQRFRLLSTSGRTVCRKISPGQIQSVLTRQPPPEPRLPKQPGRSH